jgi:pseudouridine synthase
MAQERLQKILAQAGIASRRRAEDLIREGAVTVNGRTATIGEKADLASDAIKVSGKLLQSKRPVIYLAFHKPKGVISMFADPEGRPTLADFTSRIKERLFPIGRLDFNSEGLILLTNDGGFAEKLQKRGDIPRVYHVKVRGHSQPEDLARLERGARVGDRLAKPHSVRLAESLQSKSVIEWVTLESGALDVKAAFETRGFQVERITRTAIGHLTLRGLAPGEYRVLKPSQVEALLNQPELGMRQLDADAEAAVPFVEPKARGANEPKEATPARIRPSSGERPRKPRFGGGDERPRRGFGGARDEREGGFKSRGPRKPRFGDKREGGFESRGPRKPRFGDDREGGFKSRGPRKPRFGDERPRGFGGGGKRFGSKPERSFGGASGGMIRPKGASESASSRPGSRVPKTGRRIRVTRKPRADE